VGRRRYTPSPVPLDCPRGLKRWLADELRLVSASIMAESHIEPTGTEPERPRNGDIVYADGVGWDPGSGEGFYGFEGGTWVKL
jgi:hypothetical protein